MNVYPYFAMEYLNLQDETREPSDRISQAKYVTQYVTKCYDSYTYSLIPCLKFVLFSGRICKL